MTARSTRTLRFVPLEEVARADVNPKLHAGEQIRASMDRWGFIEPILHDGRTGKLIAGHGRLEELVRRRDAGEPAPEGIRSRGGWKVPVVYGWSSATDEEAHAAGVALNRIVEMGGWDIPELHRTLTAFGAEAGSLDGTGFTTEQLDKLLATIKPVEYGGAAAPARADTSLDAKAEQYRTNGVRSIVMDFPLTEYEEMQVALRDLRHRYDAETNAVVVQRLLEEAEAAL